MAERGAYVPRWVLGTFTTLLTLGLAGGVGAAFTAVSWAAKIDERTSNNTMAVAMASAQNLDVIQRLPRVEEQTKNIDQNVEELQKQQLEMNRKIDTLLRR